MSEIKSKIYMTFLSLAVV